MGADPFDHDEFKSRQKESWDKVSPGWKKWWPVIEKGSQVVSNRLVELARIQAGQNVLDVATGIGEPALTAAKRVGPTGQVTATDQAPQMIALASERAKENGIDNIIFHEVDCEKIDYPEGSFDAVLCRWGLMFLPDLPTALGRLYKLLKPGGYLAAATWDVPAKVPGISLAMSVVMEAVQAPPPPPGLPSPFSLADTVLLKESFSQAGFNDLHTEKLNVVFKLDSPEAYTEFTKDIGAPVVTLVKTHASNREAEVWDIVTQAAEHYKVEDQSVRFNNESICIVGRKPL
ncbi:MAG TPA: class I SAM-dependent methyltransferase [Spirochaetes bacterium]|nr:class I SAM-dependent methyltransferase [Spirochaetota bacterium]